MSLKCHVETKVTSKKFSATWSLFPVCISRHGKVDRFPHGEVLDFPRRHRVTFYIEHVGIYMTLIHVAKSCVFFFFLVVWIANKLDGVRQYIM